MTNEPSRHPDLLRRFVAAPYIFTLGEGPNRICIESNDLEIALSVRDSFITLFQKNRARGLFCRLIRDVDSDSPVDGNEISIVTDGALRVMHLGQETILIHDIERSELLGFVSPCIAAHTLVSSLIPALIKLPV
jgi:hypothetical protein